MRCPACSRQSASGARFCSNCGVSLRGHRPAPISPARPSERRQLTVMFCDLVGSTDLSLALDAEDFAHAVQAYRDVCARSVRAWQGYLSRYVGDGVLAFFGYPSAAETDAWRAVMAAREITRQVPALVLPSAALQVRVSLHTGLVVVGDLVGDEAVELDGALGAVPNVAARLQLLGRPGDLVVSESTARLLPPSVVLRPLPVVTGMAGLPGAGRAMVVDEVTDMSSTRRAVSDSPLVGRRFVLDTLSHWLEASDVGARGTVLIGEAGVGKSRLVQELIRQPAAAALHWVTLTCSAERQVSPLHPFQALIDDIDEGRDANERAASPATEVVIAFGQASRDTPTPYARRRWLFERLRTYLFGLAPRIGLLMEDIHWADSTTLAWLAELLGPGGEGRPLRMLLTSRDPLGPPLAGLPTLRTEPLGRLPPGAAAELVRALCVQCPLSAFDLAEVVDHADGIPLYIEEFVRAVSTQRRDADRIPATLRDALTGTLDRLGTAREVALCASVFGRRCTYRQLHTLLDVDEATLSVEVQGLVDAGILVRRGPLPDATLEFRHALLRDTAYHTLLKTQRQDLHRRVAMLAEGGRLPAEDSLPEVLALHHSLGGNHREAVNCWLRAQAFAMRRSATVEALAHLRRALADCDQLAAAREPDAPVVELSVLRQMTAPLIAIAGWSTPELEDVYARATALCREVGDVDIQFELERGLCNMHLLRSELGRAGVLADRLMAVAQSRAPALRQAALRLMALRSKALTEFYRGRFGPSRELLSELLAMHDHQRDAGHAFASGTHPTMLAHAYLAWMHAVAGETVQSRNEIAAALLDARSEGHWFSLCYGLCFAASCEQMLDDMDAAERYATEALNLALQHNFAYWIAWARAVLGWVLGRSDPALGVAQIEAAVVSYRATGSSLVLPYFEALACDALTMAGLPDDGRQASLLRACEATGVWFWRLGGGQSC